MKHLYMEISLKPVDSENIWKLMRLQVRDDQRHFVASNTESVLEAYVTKEEGGVALPFGIYDGETPVGFVMIGYDKMPGADSLKYEQKSYCIWRFMIDASCQGRGYGSAAMQAVLDYIRTFPCGAAKFCYLSYEPDNAAARTLYYRFGFEENGEKDEDEIVAVRPL